MKHYNLLFKLLIRKQFSGNTEYNSLLPLEMIQDVHKRVHHFIRLNFTIKFLWFFEATSSFVKNLQQFKTMPLNILHNYCVGYPPMLNWILYIFGANLYFLALFFFWGKIIFHFLSLNTNAQTSNRMHYVIFIGILQTRQNRNTTNDIVTILNIKARQLIDEGPRQSNLNPQGEIALDSGSCLT